MNKNKITLMSMIVFMTVFCLSAIFYIPNTLTTNKSISNDTLVDEEAAAAPELEDNELESFSYKTSSVITVLEDPSQTEEVSAEATDIQENETLADIPVTEALAIDEIEEQVPEALAIDEAAEQVPEEAHYDNIGISIAKDYVNIRQEASTESDILGKLYKDSAVEILNTEDDWYHVESGSVKGYVKAEFIMTGISDDELIEKYGAHSIIVKVDGLNVRQNPDTESDRLTVIYQNEIYPVLETDGDWVKINIPEDNTAGYVKLKYAELMVDFKDAVSKEEEEELLKLQAEERAKKETEIKQQDSVSYSQEELRLLACLVHSEAGTQSYEGKLAVANVVLNRVNSPKYGGSIKSVIYQPGQFSVAKSGSLAKQLANYENYNSQSQKLSIKAAKAALEGANNIGSRLYFHSYKAAVRKGYDKKDSSVKLGDHLFW